MARANGHFAGGQNFNNPERKVSTNKQYHVSKCQVSENRDGSVKVTTWRYVQRTGGKPVKKNITFNVTAAGYKLAIERGYFVS